MAIYSLEFRNKLYNIISISQTISALFVGVFYAFLYNFIFKTYSDSLVQYNEIVYLLINLQEYGINVSFEIKYIVVLKIFLLGSPIIAALLSVQYLNFITHLIYNPHTHTWSKYFAINWKKIISTIIFYSIFILAPSHALMDASQIKLPSYSIYIFSVILVLGTLHSCIVLGQLTNNKKLQS